MSLNTPDSEPDFMWDGKYPFWFEEMIARSFQSIHFIEFKDDKLVVSLTGQIFRSEIQEAYNNWALNKEIEYILLENTTDTINN